MIIATILTLTLLTHENHNHKSTFSTAGIKTTLPTISTKATTTSTTGKMQILKSFLEKKLRKRNFLNFSHKDRLPTRIDKCRKK